MTEVTHLESLSVVQIDFDIWSGQTRLSAADFKLGIGGEIPPEKLAQLGSKKICDPAKLKGFHRLKSEARRMLHRYGMPFMNGYAVPVDKVNDICARLDSIMSEYSALKDAFVAGYHQAVDEWVRENPQYESAIRSGALPRSEVEKRIAFEYQIFMIQPVSGDDGNAQRLNRKVNSLGDDLIAEIVETATKLYNERLAGQTQVGIGTRQTLENLRDKVDGLSFLNQAFDPLVRLLDETIDGYKQSAAGRFITAPFLYQVIAATLIMADRDKIQLYASGGVSVDGIARTLDMTPLAVGSPAAPSNTSVLALQTPQDPPQQKSMELGVGEQKPVHEQNDVVDDIDQFFAEFQADEVVAPNPAKETAVTPTADEPVAPTPATAPVMDPKEAAQPPQDDDEDQGFF